MGSPLSCGLDMSVISAAVKVYTLMEVGQLTSKVTPYEQATRHHQLNESSVVAAFHS
jgi:hypothetical protein